jgi:protein ImuB
VIVCVHYPRFELVHVAGGAQALAGRALALAPAPGSEQRLGEVSGAAEARGVAKGMALGEALARCPDLVLLPADPVAVAEAWEATLRALESIGAAVEPARPGLAYFDAAELRSLRGSDEATLAAARNACSAIPDHRSSSASVPGRPPRLGAGPTRFCALAAALAVRLRRPLVLGDRNARRWLAGRPVDLLGYRACTERLPEPLHRLGVRTLGALAALGRAALADRFGAAGVEAHRLVSGEDDPLTPRCVQERLLETLDVGDASSGAALERVLGLLVERLLARGERRGRTLRAVELYARLLSGGGWCERVVFREALCDPERIRLALSLRLSLLPAPASTLGLAVERFGPAAGEQRSLFTQERADQRSTRALLLREALAQVRAVAGEDAALRALCVDPDSRVPERRVVLAPIAG